MTRKTPWFCGLVAALLTFLCVPIAWADRARIVIVVPSPRDPIALRLEAELTALGFEVVTEREPEAPPAREPLEATARALSAVAAVRVAPKVGGVEVWIVDRVTGKTVLTDVTAEGDTTTVEATVALRTVELLRASFLEIQEPHPARGEVPIPEEVRALSAPTADLPTAPPASQEEPPASTAVRVGVGAAAVLSAGGLDAGPHVRLGGTWMSSRRVGARVFALFPTVATHVTAVEGETSMRVALLGAGLHVEPTEIGPLTPTLDAGLAGAWLLFEGAAQAPYVATTDTVVVAAPFAGAGLDWALTSVLHLEGQALCAVALPRPILTLAGREAGSWGRPALALSLSLSMHLP